MKIEKVTESSFPRAAEVYTLSWRESHKTVCSLEFLQKRDCAAYLYGKIESLYLISDPEIVGVFCLTDWELSDLYIHPDYQGRGYGRYCVDFGINSGARFLTVLSNNEKAIRLYEKMGFRFTDRNIQLRENLWEREMEYTEKNNG